MDDVQPDGPSPILPELLFGPGRPTTIRGKNSTWSTIPNQQFFQVGPHDAATDKKIVIDLPRTGVTDMSQIYIGFDLETIVDEAGAAAAGAPALGSVRLWNGARDLFNQMRVTAGGRELMNVENYDVISAIHQSFTVPDAQLRRTVYDQEGLCPIVGTDKSSLVYVGEDINTKGFVEAGDEALFKKRPLEYSMNAGGVASNNKNFMIRMTDDMFATPRLFPLNATETTQLEITLNASARAFVFSTSFTNVHGTTDYNLSSAYPFFLYRIRNIRVYYTVYQLSPQNTALLMTGLTNGDMMFGIVERNVQSRLTPASAGDTTVSMSRRVLSLRGCIFALKNPAVFTDAETTARSIIAGTHYGYKLTGFQISVNGLRYPNERLTKNTEMRDHVLNVFGQEYDTDPPGKTRTRIFRPWFETLATDGGPGVWTQMKQKLNLCGMSLIGHPGSMFSSARNVQFLGHPQQDPTSKDVTFNWLQQSSNNKSGFDRPTYADFGTMQALAEEPYSITMDYGNNVNVSDEWDATCASTYNRNFPVVGYDMMREQRAGIISGFNTSSVEQNVEATFNFSAVHGSVPNVLVYGIFYNDATITVSANGSWGVIR